MNGCKKYTIDTVGGLNMAFSKETGEVIVELRKMIRECLYCNEFKSEGGCKQSEEMVEFIEKNKE